NPPPPPDLFDEAVVNPPGGLGEHEPRAVGIAVDERDEAVRADEDRVGLVVEVEQLEAGPALRGLPADALAVVEPLRVDVRQRLDQLHGGASDVEELEEGV